jgi:DNA-binding LytR/AlgR family response regulator
MSDKLRTILVDDEPMASKGLAKYIEDVKFIELVAIYENAMDANEGLNDHKIDLMFCDIQMPKITGLQFLKTLKNKPITIITSAFPEYALEGFELDVIDYLIKPISFERFLKAANKAKEYFDLNNDRRIQSVNEGFFFVKCDKKIEKVYFDEILYIESLHNYVAIHTLTKKLTAYLTLKNIEESVPPDKFIKVQKSFIVSLSKISGIEDDQVVVNSKHISISRTNKDEIIKTILGNNYLKR